MSHFSLSRRQARECALQILFQLDINPAPVIKDAIDAFWDQQVASRADEIKDTTGFTVDPTDTQALAAVLASKGVREFVTHLVYGVCENLRQIDGRLAGYTPNWSLNRLGGVERAILRMAVFEMFHGKATPHKVVINEAIDLAKCFCSLESGRFVNTTLDRALKDAPPLIAKPRAERRARPR
ncbi:MAG: transcription antitermination factor NusB [Kiritimatiellaeota bacterium]|nr:transcription antitermination factor NusB [Kiritimatiellota bacterium]